LPDARRLQIYLLHAARKGRLRMEMQVRVPRLKETCAAPDSQKKLHTGNRGARFQSGQPAQRPHPTGVAPARVEPLRVPIYTIMQPDAQLLSPTLSFIC
jgi:hypothetical protein